MKKAYEKYFFLLKGDIKRGIPTLILIFMISSFFDLIGISLIGLLLLLINDFDAVLKKHPHIFSFLLKTFDKKEAIFIVAMLLLASFILKAVWSVYSQKKISFFLSKLTIKLKMRLVNLYQNANYLFHLQKNSSDLMNRVYSVDGFINNVFLTFLNVTSSLFSMGSIILFLIIIHPFITLFLTISIGLTFFLYKFFYKKKLIDAGKSLAVFNSEIGRSILQTLSGLREIRVFGTESFFVKKIESAAEGYSQSVSLCSSLQIIPRCAIECFASIFLVSMLLVAFIFEANPLDVIPVLGVFSAACIKLLPVISRLITQISQFHSATYITEILYNEINILEHDIKNNFSANCAKIDFLKFSLNSVSFMYPNSKKNALSDIDLSFFRGQSIGFMGGSGAGKSTLIGIFLGLIEPDKGGVFIDDLPLKNLRGWLNNVAYIPQTIFLLDDTLKNNIAFGIPDSDIDEKKLNNAIMMSQLSDVVSNLINGVDTLIGENGVRLSGGQRQRVALARALYYEREIIIMDEATSSLDNITEREIIKAIKKLHGIKTLIIIAHRLTTLQYCDNIIQLENGRIVFQGTFDSMLKENDTYLINS